VNLETTTLQPRPAQVWDQLAEHLRSLPGVETVTLTIWPLMSGESSVGTVAVDGGPPSDVFTDILHVAPGWVDAMKIPWIDGRDFQLNDRSRSVAIVNQAFAIQFMQGRNPVGKTFTNGVNQLEIVGYVADARSRDNLRIPIRPTMYLPFHVAADLAGAFQPMSRGTFVVRTSVSNPMAMALLFRKEGRVTRPGFCVGN